MNSIHDTGTPLTAQGRNLGLMLGFVPHSIPPFQSASPSASPYKSLPGPPTLSQCWGITHPRSASSLTDQNLLLPVSCPRLVPQGSQRELTLIGGGHTPAQTSSGTPTRFRSEQSLKGSPAAWFPLLLPCSSLSIHTLHSCLPIRSSS